MRSWLTYIAAFIAGLCGAFAAFLAVGGLAYDQLSEMEFIVVMLVTSVLSAFAAFVLIYALAHQWTPGAMQVLLGLAACFGLALLGGLLILSEVVGLGEGIAIVVLFAFGLGRYLTVRFGNG